MKVLIASPIDGDAIAELRSRHDVVCAFENGGGGLRDRLADREVLVFRSGVEIDGSLLAAAPSLRALIRAGSGLDNVDLECVRRHGLELIVLPGPGAVAVAELAFALMLALSRQVIMAHDLLRTGRWAKREIVGHLLAGRTLGVVGIGTIGTEVARRGVFWGMKVLGCVEHRSVERATGMRVRGIALVGLEQLLVEADVVSLHVPLKASTRHLIDARAIARMKPGALLINLARGGVVDEEALAAGLRDGAPGGAALDVHELGEGDFVPPLAALPNVILTPHIGGSTVESQRALGSEIVRAVEGLDPAPSFLPVSPGRRLSASASFSGS